MHQYDPYDYTLKDKDYCETWGKPYAAAPACAWSLEPYHDKTFAKVKNMWIDAGVPVIADGGLRTSGDRGGVCNLGDRRVSQYGGNDPRRRG